MLPTQDEPTAVPTCSEPISRPAPSPLKFSVVAATWLSSVLFVLAFPQYGDVCGLDWLVWLCLVPFFLAATGAGFRRGAFLGYFLGVGIEGAGFLWIYRSILAYGGDLPFGVGPLFFLVWLAGASLVWAALGAALGRCRDLHAALWVLPFWVGLEHFFPRLWPWHIGGAVHARMWLVQNADLFGASGLSLLVLFANWVGACSLRWVVRGGSFPRIGAPILVVLLIAANLYGAYRLDFLQRFEAAREPLRALLVQGALTSEFRRERGLEYYRATTVAAREGEPPVDLVVWPEGAIPVGFDLTRGSDPWIAFDHFKVERPTFDVPLIAGSAGWVSGRVPEQSNIAVYLRPGAAPQFYEKMIRVPFGERVPFESLIGSLGFPIGNISAGESSPLMAFGEHQFRCLVCYEVILPDFVRVQSHGVDFFVNLTEDIWYGLTAHIPQHLSVLRLRVIENRTPLVRCTNIGPSGVCSITGDFDGGSSIFSPEELVREFRPGSVWSLYKAGGWAFPVVMLVLAGVRFGFLRRRSINISAPR